MFENKLKNTIKNFFGSQDFENVLEFDQDEILNPYNEIKVDHNVFIPKEDENRLPFKSRDDLLKFIDGNPKKVSGERFNPYEDNSGSSLSIRYDDFIIVAADTRHSSESGINSRDCSKIFRIKDFLISFTGFYGDGIELFNILSYEVELYEALGPINIHALASLASKLMYSRRFFPFYVYLTISGFDNGKPYVYRYDPVGGYEDVNVICNGSGAPLIQPLLDSFIDLKNWHGDKPVIDREYAIRIVVKAFDAASERDVKTGDGLELYIMTKDEIKRDFMSLRKD
ncbi:Proteasome subunit beta type-1 [Nosema bombycis CQ1]|uniref:Proteasome subunit beta n=1 Tax=Nosema bombycis (strain CQ1 / CVCC 102059) TaxID=578461 RepID=R0KLX2_NOSB1|nr:Proteasome subunit beta type-1 [Nosema bombycis CQ1]|eukprot:EOB11142.1 Proteasome subunit beta type-1 [Nosema bombycis CQ1]